MTVVPSPVAVIEKVPAVLEVYVYAPQAGDPPDATGGIGGTKGPALWLSPLTADLPGVVTLGGETFTHGRWARRPLPAARDA